MKNISQYQHFSSKPARQSGAVLVISLIMLLLLTIIGVSGSQVTNLEEKMAGNSRNYNLAFQAAESALRAGEVATATVADVNLYNQNDPVPIDWTSRKVTPYSDGTLYGLYQSPKFIIEKLDCSSAACDDSREGNPLEPGTPSDVANKSLYRITARGVGGSADAVVTLQSIYKR